MPDLTFSELPIDRNPLTKKPTSETWEQGIVMSRAEQTRNRMPNVSLSQAEAVAKAAIQRGKEPMDAGFWYHQPVGGRAVSAAPSTRTARRGRSGDEPPPATEVAAAAGR